MRNLFLSSKRGVAAQTTLEKDFDTQRTMLRALVEMQQSIDRSLARIEFQPDGIILDANQNFLSAIEYSIEEIRGKHHRIFVEPTYAVSEEYQRFWKRLANGESFSGQFKRVAKKQPNSLDRCNLLSCLRPKWEGPESGQIRAGYHRIQSQRTTHGWSERSCEPTVCCD